MSTASGCKGFSTDLHRSWKADGVPCILELIGRVFSDFRTTVFVGINEDLVRAQGFDEVKIAR